MIARPRRRVARRARGFIGALGFAGLVVSGCGPDPSDVLGALAPHGVAPSGGSAVNGLLDEWRVRADVNTVRAGPVLFTFANVGTQVHEMLVTRTDIAPGQIPVDAATNTFNEDDPASKVLDEISEFDPGKTGSVTINLAPGTYQLVCNVPAHYANGMSMAFTVTR
jgi:plastocyanin